jgi:hypothetical protein
VNEHYSEYFFYDKSNGKVVKQNKRKQTQWPVVRKRNVPTKQPPFVGEVKVVPLLR